MKLSKYTILITIILFGCTNAQLEDTSPSTILDSSQDSELDLFRKSVTSKISTFYESEDENRLDILGSPDLDQIRIFKNHFEQLISFTPVFHDNSKFTEAIIIGVMAKNRLQIVAIVRGRLNQLTYRTGNRQVTALTYAALFDAFDRAMFNIYDADYAAIISNSNSLASRSQANSIQTDGLKDQKFEWVDIEQCIEILSGYGPENSDPDYGFSYEECWVIGSYWVDSPGSITIDAGSSGGGSGSGNYRNCAGAVSCFPLVKYPPGSDYDTKYPKLTEFLKNELPNIADKEKVLEALKKYSFLSEDEIKEKLKWGEGPTIIIKPLNDGRSGEFNANTPDKIYLSSDFANDIERATIGKIRSDALLFLAGVTILHEFVHYGEFNSGNWANTGDQEYGEIFEKDAFGYVVTYSNMKMVLKKNK